MAKITKRTVDALKPRANSFIAFDDDVKGFGLRVMPSGIKSYVLEYRPGSGGRGIAKKRLTLGRHGSMTPEQARRAALEALARVRLGEDPQAEKSRQRASLTIGGLIEVFLREHVSKKCKPGTAYGYETALKRLRDAHGSIKADALTRAHVAALHASLASTPFAANRFLAAISKMFSWASDRGLLPDDHINPAVRIERYREHRRERFLASGELANLGDALRLGEPVLDPFAVAAIRLLILTGARLREVLDAQWQYVDFERGILFLPDSKTGRKPVYLSAPACQLLASLPRLEGNPHIIAGLKDGAPKADLKKPWAAVTKAAGLEGVRIHDLRHSFASVGAGASLGLPIIGKLLGHAQAATTHRYAHLDAAPVRRAAETIGATIAAAMDGGASNVVPLAKAR